ncbi:MAG: hypothetical protein ABI831_04605 [Betaproteobacteria bacterium]
MHSGGQIGQTALSVVNPQTQQPLACNAFTLQFNQAASVAFYL